MSADSDPTVPNTLVRHDPGLRSLDDLSMIANALGIREDMITHKDALTELIEYLHTYNSLTPFMVSVLSSSWIVEETDASMTLEEKDSRHDISSQVPTEVPYLEILGNLLDCAHSFSITVSLVGAMFFNAEPIKWMWFPTKEDHITALAYVLMLYLYLYENLLQEHSTAKREVMLVTYYTALENLRKFRCSICGGNYKDGSSSPRICDICEPEEGEIIEPPTFEFPINQSQSLPWGVCTHRTGDPECVHFL
ncbi:hypothetical protein F5Y10DRAFT_266092 [Nemania abortiva]|nr:hypothetical protein F5Y10DRAFT_266092 [Nemania abortiva]